MTRTDRSLGTDHNGFPHERLQVARGRRSGIPVATALGLEWTSVDLLREQVDVLVPAATGGVLTQAAAKACRARLIVGPANNQLADDSMQAMHDLAASLQPDLAEVAR